MCSDSVAMKQQEKAVLDTVAGRRAAQLQKQDPAVKASYVLDDVLPRGVVKSERDGKIVDLEFLESAATAGEAANLEAYVFAANELGAVTVHLPEEKYRKDLAASILGTIQDSIRTGGANGEFRFAGYVYDIMGNFKRVR